MRTCFPVAVVKYHNQKQCRGRKGLFSLAYRLHSITEGSQHRDSRQELEEETKEDQSSLAPGLTSAT